MHAETLVYESVWNGTKSHNGGQLMVVAEERTMAKELITKDADGWGFETLDGRKAGYPSRDAARAARKEWMAAPTEKREQEMQLPTATPIVAPPAPVKKPTRSKVTPDEVANVLLLRAAGMSFQRIEAELGWDDFHGCKARRIVLDNAVK